MKKLICAFAACISLAYATDTRNLINVQNNYQSALADLNSKKDIVTELTDDVSNAKNDVDNANKNLLQAQKDLKEAQTKLQQKNAALTRVKKDANASQQNVAIARKAVDQAWK